MTTIKDHRPKTRILGALSTMLAATALVLAGCSPSGVGSAADAASSSASSSDTFFTTDQVHSIEISMDEYEYQDMLTTYATSGDKEWISVAVTIDGTTIENAGLRLKGNSSLRSALASSRGVSLTEDDLAAEESDAGDSTASAANPETIPWLIRLNKYVDGQDYLGRYDFVVRGNDTESSLNEAVAVAMLEEAGLAAYRVAFTAFSVNGSEAKLRLVSEVPDDQLWNEDWFGTEGATWKADSDGDWNYHGDDGSDYEAIWKQRTGDDDMTPIVEFMDFINNSTDEEFEASLAENLDVEQFAKYLAIEDLMNNTDTISGMGNNGYLHYDPSTGQMTLIAWDHDRAFQAMGGAPAGGGRGGRTRPDGGNLPEGMEPPTGGMPDGEAPRNMERPTDGPQSGQTMPEPPDGFDAADSQFGGGGFGGGGMASNILETRFRASEVFQSMYDQAYASLTETLIDSGFAEQTLDRYQQLLLDEAADLVSSSVVDTEAETIRTQLTADAASLSGQRTASGDNGGQSS